MNNVIHASTQHRKIWFRILSTMSVVWIAGLPAVSLVRADVIWIKGQSEPIFGRLVENDGQTVIFQPVGAAESRRSQYDRSSIESLVINIDPRRLEKLHPTDLTAYRDYAEELSVQKKDPAARRLAIRLYLIAAAQGPEDLQQSALSGLISLASDEQELEKWTMLQRLTQSANAGTIRQQSKTVQRIDPAQKQLALRIVQAIRQGNGSEASQMLLQPAARESLGHWNHICAVDELSKMAALNRPTLSQLHQLLQIEISIFNNESPVEIDRKRNNENWGESAQASSRMKGLIPSFQNATEFDPAESVYRAGRWVVPN